MNVYIGSNSRLPSTYQEVEYISSSNEQYIETGLSSDGSYLKADYKFQLLSTSSNRSDTPPFIRGPVDGGRLYQTIDSYRTNFQFGAGDDDIVLGSIATNTDYKVVAEWNSGTLSTNINGTTSTNSYSGGLSTHTIPIFCRWRSTNYGYNAFSSIKLYYFKLYTASNTLARDLVPCYRKSDNVIGMYDIVNNQFYTNSGTGTFTKGADVYTNVLKNAYIGEYKGYEYSYDFRNKTKAEAESDGWVFDSATYGFSSNGISLTSGGVGYIRYTVDISSYKTLKLSGTGTVSGTYTGISLIGGTTSVGFVNWLYRPSGLGVFYNDANHYVGSALGYGNFSWEIEIDLDTGNLTSSCSNGQTITGTLNSSYLSALKQNNTTLGIGFNDAGGYIQTFKAQAIPA